MKIKITEIPDEKPHTAGQDDTAIPQMKIKITEIPLEKSSIPQYLKPPCPPLKQALPPRKWNGFPPARKQPAVMLMAE